jgi:hypothetical protein
MYGVKLRYLASVFLDAESIEPSRASMTEVSALLGDDELMPALVEERSPAGVRTRMGFRSSSGEWQLVLASQRFDFLQLPTDASGSNLGDFSEFCRRASTRLISVLGHYRRKGYRLAAVQEGFLPDMSESDITSVGARLLRFPRAGADPTTVVEWDWRTVTRPRREFGQVTEPTNTIVTVKRMVAALTYRGGTDAQARKDRIRVDFDINTLPDDPRARFGPEEIAAFFDGAGRWHQELGERIVPFILGREQNASDLAAETTAY